MQSIRSWFLQPYPFERQWKQVWRSGISAALFVTCFLFFFKPFGTRIQSGEEWGYFLVCGCFGLITLAITLATHAFCLLFPKTFDEEYWNVWKEILFNLVFVGAIGTGNLLFAHLFWGVPLNGKTFWLWQGLTFAVGIFPILFGAFFGQMKWSKRYASEAALLAGGPAFAQENVAQKPVTFTGENQHEVLTLQPDQIVYIAAQDNYVQVFYFENEALKSRLLRATLRKKEGTLEAWPQFFRCHRTYLVNFDHVSKVSGNAQGYRLHLRGIEESIPVSRNLNEQVRKRLGPI